MKAAVVVIGVSSALLLLGCASANDEEQARNGCLEDAMRHLPSGAEHVDTSTIWTVNRSEALREMTESRLREMPENPLREMADNPLPADPEDVEIWDSGGEIWFRVDGEDRNATMHCSAEFENGEPVKIRAVVTF